MWVHCISVPTHANKPPPRNMNMFNSINQLIECPALGIDMSVEIGRPSAKDLPPALGPSAPNFDVIGRDPVQVTCPHCQQVCLICFFSNHATDSFRQNFLTAIPISYSLSFKDRLFLILLRQAIPYPIKTGSILPPLNQQVQSPAIKRVCLHQVIRRISI